VRLDKLYDIQEKFKKFINWKTNSSSMQFEVVNLGINTMPQKINLGKNILLNKNRFISNYSRNTKTHFPRHMRISRCMTPKTYNT
jgi:hypothetical protein